MKVTECGDRCYDYLLESSAHYPFVLGPKNIRWVVNAGTLMLTVVVVIVFIVVRIVTSL